ncbi:MAG: OmpA family protein [Bacteroidetes bacterium]|nr:OmpA family protein [Bacteroidota bacterium]
MRISILFLVALTLLASCVSSKKFKALEEQRRVCSEDLEKFKQSSQQFQSQSELLQVELDAANKTIEALRKDTARLGNSQRSLMRELGNATKELGDLAKTFDRYKSTGQKETSVLQKELEQKKSELQNKSEALVTLEAALRNKQQLLEERERRVNELEDLLKRQEDALNLLKKKVSEALVGFENQGLKVEEKNGKIYVSLEAKLLFKSGSIIVESEGKKALLQIGKALENEKDLEIVVEGHTDTDKLNSVAFPRNNWELSVLRATSVVEILLANSKMNPAKLIAAGRSEFQPVDPADKAKNRRIEIIISPNLDELFDIISKD